MTIELVQDGKEKYYVNPEGHIPQELVLQLESRVVQSKTGNFYYLSNSNQYFLTRHILINTLNQPMTSLLSVLQGKYNSEEMEKIKTENIKKLVSRIDELVSEIKKGDIHLPDVDQITLNYLLCNFENLKNAALLEDFTKLKQADIDIHKQYERTKSCPEGNEADAKTLIDLLQK